MFIDPLGLWTVAQILPMPSQNLVDAAAGFGDGITGGGTDWLRDLLNINQQVDHCSIYYQNSEIAGVPVGIIAAGGVTVKAVGTLGRLAANAGRAGRGIGKGDEVITRITRQGDQAVKIIRKDGSIVDISPKRVKEFTPNTHPKAPSGTLQKTKFEDALPGSKGFKRAPTQQELDVLKDLTK